MSPAKPPTHRQCAVQQVNERLTEQHPSLRVKQLRIEHECQRLIEKGEAQRVWRRRITLPVVVHVVYKTDEQNIPDEQVASQIDVLNQDYRGDQPRPREDPRRLDEPRGRSQHRVRARRDHAHGDRARLVRHRRHGQAQGGRRRRPEADHEVPQHLGLQPRRGAARLRAVPRRPGQDRRRGDPLHGVRHHRRGGGAVQPRAHRDARGRALAQPAPHLGRQDRLLGLRPGVRHPEGADAQLRHPDVAAHHLQQRPERRHVHELHGLRRRRRDVHVHPGPGGAHQRHARRPAQEDRRAL